MTLRSRSPTSRALPVRWLLLALLLASVPACAPQPVTMTREPTTLRLVTADSCAEMMGASAAAYEAAHPWVTVTSQVLNNALAADALEDGEADLAFLSWGAMDPGPNRSFWMEPFVRDGVAVIVHPDSPFSSIGLARLHQIFRGRLQEWQGLVLSVVSREDGSGTRAAFESIVLGGAETTLNAVVMPSSEAVVDYVAGTPSAIGYVSTRRLDDRVRVLAVEGVLPTEEAVTDGRYPLWRELHLVTLGEPTGEARQFVQWLLRGGGRATVVEGSGR